MRTGHLLGLVALLIFTLAAAGCNQGVPAPNLPPPAPSVGSHDHDGHDHEHRQDHDHRHHPYPHADHPLGPKTLKEQPENQIPQ